MDTTMFITNSPLFPRFFLGVAILAASLVSTTAGSALVGLWRFDESEGDIANDSSGLDNGGTLYGENGNVPERVPGQTGFGGALAFRNNTVDHSLVNIPGNPALKIGMTADDTWSLAVWAYESTDGTGDHVATYGRFLSQDDGNGIQWDSGAPGDSQVYLWHGTLSEWRVGFEIGSSASPVFDQWIHWTLVYDGQNLSLYRNGNQGLLGGKVSLPVRASLNWAGYSGAIQIGSQVNMAGREWNGKLDDVAVFKGALTEAEIRAIMTGDFSLYLAGPPKIATQPQDQSVNQGFDAVFSVIATSDTPMSYQWQFNGTELPSATNSTLVITNAQSSKAGTYTVLIRNASGLTTSRSAVLTVLVPLPPRLAGLWRFDEGDGAEVHDSSGFANHGVLATDGGTVPVWIDSRPGFGKAIQFQATGDHNYVDVPASDSLKFGMTANDTWTITAWAYEGSDGIGQFVSSYGRLFAQNGGYGINFNSGSTLSSDSQYYIWHHQLTDWQRGFGTDGVLVPLLDQWVHLALVYDGNNLTLYHDGNQGAQGGKTSIKVRAGLDWTGYSSAIQIGTMLNMGGDHNWNGMIDDFAIFTGALSESQIQTVMAGDFSVFLLNPAPLLSITRSGNQLAVSWSFGTIQTTSDVSTGWQDLPDAHSPLVVAPADARRFYRVRY